MNDLVLYALALAWVIFIINECVRLVRKPGGFDDF